MSEEKQEVAQLTKFLRGIVKRKNPDDMIETAKEAGLKKTLNVFDLIILGIGAVVGSGIFTIIGVAAAGGPEHVGAGPALVVSMILAAVACVFSALCYSEFASMIPVAGSAYTYTFATMGEFMAWIIGWILMLEYAIGYIAVLNAWTGYFMQIVKGFTFLPHWLTEPPLWLLFDHKTAVAKYLAAGLNPAEHIPVLFGVIPISFNLPGIIATLVIAAILVRGIKESTKAAAIMVLIKLGVILTFVVVGAFYVKPQNWVPFAPNGFEGIFMGAFIIFYAYIGFDAISTAAEETKNPEKDLPIGIIGTLAVCTLLYIAVALVLTGMVPLSEIDLRASIAVAMKSVGQNWFAYLIALGALTGLTSVLLVLQLGASRILYAMSRDKFLPPVMQKVHKKFKTPYVITWALAIICILGSLVLDLNVAAELCNFGTFTSFIIVCVAVLILRKTDPDRPRPFRVPFVPLFPILGILCCSALMIYSMQFLKTSRLLFPLWLIIGAVIYFSYGYKKNRDNEKGQDNIEQ